MAMMKSSNTEWLGDIPAEWDVAQIGNYYELRNEKVSDYDFEPLSVTMKGIVPQLATAAKSDDHSNRKLVKKGDFVINSRSDRRGSCGISPLNGSVSLINIVMEPRGEMNPQYYNWLFHTEQFADEFYKWGHGIVDDLWTTRWQEMKKILIVAPSPDEQQAIADYLDETCSKIDEIIAEAKASIDEYKELKQAVIFDGISLGTRKCCDYKRTTLKGIEKIPIEWEYRKLKFLIRYIESGVSVNAGNEPATELEYGVLKTSCVSKMIFLPSENKSVNKDEYDRVKCPVCGDTIIVSRMNTPDLVGACAYIEKNIDNIFLPDRLWQVHFNDNVNVKYIYYCLISPYIRNYYSSLSTGTSSSMQNISQGQFTNAIIPYPPLEEQKEIVDFLDKRTKEIDSLIAEKQSLIADLEAYKKSLIYEVVTGKRKVV